MKFDCNQLVKDQLNLALRGGKIECSNGGSFTQNDDDESSIGILQKQTSGSENGFPIWYYGRVILLILVTELMLY